MRKCPRCSSDTQCCSTVVHAEKKSSYLATALINIKKPMYITQSKIFTNSINTYTINQEHDSYNINTALKYCQNNASKKQYCHAY
jgi:hypothetical protein